MGETARTAQGLTQLLPELWVVAANIIKVYGIASESNEERDRRRSDNSRRRRHWQGRRHVRLGNLRAAKCPTRLFTRLFCDQTRDSIDLAICDLHFCGETL